MYALSSTKAPSARAKKIKEASVEERGTIVRSLRAEKQRLTDRTDGELYFKASDRLFEAGRARLEENDHLFPCRA